MQLSINMSLKEVATTMPVLNHSQLRVLSTEYKISILYNIY